MAAEAEEQPCTRLIVSGMLAEEHEHHAVTLADGMLAEEGEQHCEVVEVLDRLAEKGVLAYELAKAQHQAACDVAASRAVAAVLKVTAIWWTHVVALEVLVVGEAALVIEKSVAAAHIGLAC